MRRILGNDRGYATIVAAGIIVAIIGLLFVVLGAVRLVLADHQARLAADLSAVAGAWAVTQGEDGCAAARETARLNDAELLDCTIEGADVTVTATVLTRSVKARAGPV